MIDKTFGEWLQIEMNARGMTQADLARATGFATSSVAYLVNNKRNPTAESCARIAKAFRFTVTDVMIAAGLPVDKPKYPPEIQELASIFNNLSADDRNRLMDIARMFLRNQQR